MQERPLAAIMFTGIVGYTALMDCDEEMVLYAQAKNH
jgi:class 3 adenylate cyclase